MAWLHKWLNDHVLTVVYLVNNISIQLINNTFNTFFDYRLTNNVSGVVLKFGNNEHVQNLSKPNRPAIKDKTKVNVKL